MENSDDRNSAVSILENTFSNINNWLSFAEAKNAALIAFNIAVLTVNKYAWFNRALCVDIGSMCCILILIIIA